MRHSILPEPVVLPTRLKVLLLLGAAGLTAVLVRAHRDKTSEARPNRKNAGSGSATPKPRAARTPSGDPWLRREPPAPKRALGNGKPVEPPRASNRSRQSASAPSHA